MRSSCSKALAILAISPGRAPAAFAVSRHVAVAAATSFFSKASHDAREESDIVVRASERRQLTFPGLGIREDLLSPNLAGPIEMLLSSIEPGADCGEAYSHGGDEAGFLLCGTLDLWVGDRHFTLHEGDSFSFVSSTPHRYKNNGRVTTRIVWIITPPFY